MKDKLERYVMTFADFTFGTLALFMLSAVWVLMVAGVYRGICYLLN